MKLTLIALFALFIFTSCNSEKENSHIPAPLNKHSAVIYDYKEGAEVLGNYTGYYHQGNYIWNITMNLAWDKVIALNGKKGLNLDTNNKTALKMLKIFNDSIFGAEDIDEESYKIKTKITKNELEIVVNFFKKIKYSEKFTKETVWFTGKYITGSETKAVKGFGGNPENIKIINYENDDKFIVSIVLEDDSNELILAKGYDMKDPDALLLKINKCSNRINLTKDDYFKVPNIKFKYERKYHCFENKINKDKNSEIIKIRKISEDIDFDMNNIGTTTRIISKMLVAHPGMLGGPKDNSYTEKVEITHKWIILDKPYWIIMKKKNSSRPFFIIGINNDKFMTKDKKLSDFKTTLIESDKIEDGTESGENHEDNKEWGYVRIAEPETPFKNNKITLTRHSLFSGNHGIKWQKRKKKLLRIRVEADMIKGNLTSQQIQKAVNKGIGQIRYCYKKELIRSPRLKGNLTVLWKINPKGKVVSAKIDSVTLENKKIQICIKAAIKNLIFPEPEDGGYVQVKYTFGFKPY